MTSDEEAEIKQEIVSLATKYQRAMGECFWLEGQMFRLRQKLKPITAEEVVASLEQCWNIGRKAGVLTYYDEYLTADSSVKDYKETGE